MRGKLQRSSQVWFVLGITPAHAGKTSALLLPLCPLEDHPRACGENKAPTSNAAIGKGSPPRMRGKRLTLRLGQRLVGITPAHAGKTSTKCGRSSTRRDHPRACGENDEERAQLIVDWGSPPRMRGKPPVRLVITGAAGITPAHAGKTLRKWRISVVDPSPQPQSSLTSRRADASSGSQRAPCAAPV